MRELVLRCFLVAVVCPVALRAQSQPPVDVLITGGTVVDGTGTPGRRADIGVRGDRVVFIGDATAARITAGRTIDARGLVVAPGFIDPHAHVMGDLSNGDPKRRANLAYLMQGVTTTITGNDGGGPADVAETLAAWTRAGVGTNAALYVGQGTVRRMVMAMSDAKPTPAQLDSMRALVRLGVAGGALGMSTGLYYAPGSYATTEEVIELAKVAGRGGGVYDSHLRDESSYTVGLLGAVREALRIGREANMAVNISHVKALGADVWGRSDSVIAVVEEAQRRGQRVTADQYPYTASGSSVGASLLPRWAEAGGRDSLRARTANAATRAKLVAEMTDNLRRRGGAEALLITSTRDTTLLGKTLAQIATARGAPPIEAALDIILKGDASVASFNMKDSDIEAFLVRPWVMTGSDGSDGHPRKYGTFPRVYHDYVVEKKLLTVEQFVHRSAAIAAAMFGLRDRGVLAQGKFADIVVFDPRTFRDRSTYEKPIELAEGVRWVLVNGRIAVADGVLADGTGGRALRREAATR
jgi:N-acyl-D-amino-acid deacylase